jgi:hypothetical protein
MSLRDKLLTPRVARAAMSPLGILLAGAGAAVGVVTGLGIPGAIALGVAAWGARVAVAVPRGEKGPNIDAYALVDPWRRFVLHAQQARNRFERAVKSTREGPIRDRLASIGSRIDTGVEDVWRVANRGQELSRARAQLDPTTAKAELERTQVELAASPNSRHLQAAVESLQSQLASAERMAATVVEAEQQLRLLDARLDETVARAIELSVGTGDEAGLRGLDSDVGDIVNELESLRLALEDTHQTMAPPSIDLPSFEAAPLPPPDDEEGEAGGTVAGRPGG